MSRESTWFATSTDSNSTYPKPGVKTKVTLRQTSVRVDDDIGVDDLAELAKILDQIVVACRPPKSADEQFPEAFRFYIIRNVAIFLECFVHFDDSAFDYMGFRG